MIQWNNNDLYISWFISPVINHKSKSTYLETNFAYELRHRLVGVELVDDYVFGQPGAPVRLLRICMVDISTFILVYPNSIEFLLVKISS